MYNIKKKFQNRPESPIGHPCKSLAEAQQIVQKHLKMDADHRVNATYMIYEGMDLVETLDQSKLQKTAGSEAPSDTGSQQKGTGQRFSPTPFNMTPAPKGSPRSPFKDEESGKDKK